MPKSAKVDFGEDSGHSRANEKAAALAAAFVNSIAPLDQQGVVAVDCRRALKGCDQYLYIASVAVIVPEQIAGRIVIDELTARLNRS